MVELVVRLVFSLAVVLGLLWLCVRLAGRRFGSRSHAMVQVLHRQSISRNAAVTVISVGQRVLVLGATDQQVRVLAELDPAEVVEDEIGTYSDPDMAGVEPVPARALAPVVKQAAGTVAPVALLHRGSETPSSQAVATARLSAAIAGALAAIPDHSAAGPACTAAGVGPDGPDGPDGPLSDERAVAVVGRRRLTVGAVTSPSAYRGSHAHSDPCSATPPPASRRAQVVPVSQLAPAQEVHEVRGVSVAGELLEQLERFEVMASAGSAARISGDSSVSTAAHSAAVGGKARHGATAPDRGRLAGSVLAPQTWRLAWGAVTGRAS